MHNKATEQIKHKKARTQTVRTVAEHFCKRISAAEKLSEHFVRIPEMEACEAVIETAAEVEVCTTALSR